MCQTYKTLRICDTGVTISSSRCMEMKIWFLPTKFDNSQIQSWCTIRSSNIKIWDLKQVLFKLLVAPCFFRHSSSQCAVPRVRKWVGNQGSWIRVGDWPLKVKSFFSSWRQTTNNWTSVQRHGTAPALLCRPFVLAQHLRRRAKRVRTEEADRFKKKTI